MFISGAVALRLFLFAKGIQKKNQKRESPEQILLAYMKCVSEKKYEEMYGMLTEGSTKIISKSDFAARNSAIYEGIEMKNMRVMIAGYDNEKLTVTYDTSFDTVAGNVSFENEAVFLEEDDKYKLAWSDSVIFPSLECLIKSEYLLYRQNEERFSTAMEEYLRERVWHLQ